MDIDRTPEHSRPSGRQSEGVLGPVEVRRIHPFQARKTYVCPGCSNEIHPGVGHVVVVPQAAPDLRRHWHRVCWERRDRRRAGGGRSR